MAPPVGLMQNRLVSRPRCGEDRVVPPVPAVPRIKAETSGALDVEMFNEIQGMTESCRRQRCRVMCGD